MRSLLLSLFLLVSASATVHAGTEWTSDYETAAKLAAEKKRLIFVLFTNSKTCVPCRMLKDAVLSKPEFADYAAKRLILLQVDYAPYLDKKKTLNEIEAEKKVPKELWMNGRGPWPYLFVLSPEKKVLYSGKAGDPSRGDVKNYITFLEGLGK